MSPEVKDIIVEDITFVLSKTTISKNHVSSKNGSKEEFRKFQ